MSSDGTSWAFSLSSCFNIKAPSSSTQRVHVWVIAGPRGPLTGSDNSTRPYWMNGCVMCNDITSWAGFRVEDMLLILPSWPRLGPLHCVRVVYTSKIWLSLPKVEICWGPKWRSRSVVVTEASGNKHTTLDVRRCSCVCIPAQTEVCSFIRFGLFVCSFKFSTASWLRSVILFCEWDHTKLTRRSV